MVSREEPREKKKKGKRGKRGGSDAQAATSNAPPSRTELAEKLVEDVDEKMAKTKTIPAPDGSVTDEYAHVPGG